MRRNGFCLSCFEQQEAILQEVVNMKNEKKKNPVSFKVA